MNPIVKIDGDVVCMVMSVKEARIVYTLVGLLHADEKFADQLYQALCTNLEGFPSVIHPSYIEVKHG